MQSFSHFKKYYSLALMGALFMSIVIIGCEDDPILEPNTDDPSGGGSYGKMIMTDSLDAKMLYEENPEVY